MSHKNYENPEKNFGESKEDQLAELLGSVVGARNRFAVNLDTINEHAEQLKKACVDEGRDPGEDPTLIFLAGQAVNMHQVLETLSMIFDGHNLRQDPASAGDVFAEILETDVEG